MENLSLPTSPEALRKQAEQLLKAAEEAEKSAMRMTSSTKTPASEAGNMPLQERCSASWTSSLTAWTR